MRQFKLDTATAPGPYALQQEIPAHQSDLQVEISTPLGWVTQARLLALSTGSPLGDGQLIDEVLVRPAPTYTALVNLPHRLLRGRPADRGGHGRHLPPALVASGDHDHPCPGLRGAGGADLEGRRVPGVPA